MVEFTRESGQVLKNFVRSGNVLIWPFVFLIQIENLSLGKSECRHLFDERIVTKFQSVFRYTQQI